MTAIILAAGVGKRLLTASGGRPKCLVEIGFGAEAVRAAVGDEIGGVRIRFVVNHRFREGAILSLWAARDCLSGAVLVMDADVLCPPAMLDRLVRSPEPNCFLLDASVENTGEEQMLLTTDGRVRDIVRGGAPGYQLAGESVGFLKLSAEAACLLRDLLAERVARGDTGIEHEEVYPDLLARVPVGFERVDGMPWTEIDFPEDIERAEREVLPRLGA